MSPSELYLYELQEKRAKWKRRLRGLSLVLGLYGLTIGTLWLLLISPVPKLKNVFVSGSLKIGQNEILDVVRTMVFENSWQRNFLGFDNILAWSTDVRLKSVALLPMVKTVGIERDWLNKTIRIVAEDRKPYGIWCVQGDLPNCYWFDDEGVIFQKAAIAEGSLIKTVNDYSGRAIGLGSHILPEKFLKIFFQVLEATKNIGVGTKEVRLDSLEKEELSIATYAGTTFYFSLRYPAKNAVDTINTLREKVDFSKLEYVDFRVENRVYYK